jgi:8-oxo-dGTP pyrophosphatase MutT (NUDIX family)
MEYFDLYDEFGQSLNKKALRGTKLDVGEFHIVVNIWIRNSERNYLIQQRNKLSDKIPFMWATTAGAAVAGDNSLDTAAKETYEELGVLIDKKEFKFLKRYLIKDDFASFLLDVYLVEKDVLLKDLKIDEIEVKDVKYLSMQDILKQKDSNTFFDYGFFIKHKNYFELIEKS